MVELRGPGGAGEPDGRCRRASWQSTSLDIDRRRIPGKMMDSAFEVDRLVRTAGSLPETRRDLVERIRAEIEAGTYETPEKVDALVDRLLDVLGDDLVDGKSDGRPL
jgi:hypothetical protein